MATLWIVGGVNGAGETTFTMLEPIKSLLGELRTLNPDALVPGLMHDHPEWSLLEANLEAVRASERELVDCLDNGTSVRIETVLSSDKYLRYAKRAVAEGWLVGLIYVALPSVEVSMARVAARVAKGGHDVPVDKLRLRWSRSLDNLAVFAQIVERMLVFSNEDPTGEPLLIAEKIEGRIEIHDPDALPEVTARLRKLE